MAARTHTYQDTSGGQLPPTSSATILGSPTAMTFDTVAVSAPASPDWTRPDSTTFRCATAGSYVVVGSVHFNETGSNFSAVAAALQAKSGTTLTGFLSEGGKVTSFQARKAGVPILAYLHNVGVGDEFEIVIGCQRSGAVVTTVAGESHIQIIPITPADVLILERDLPSDANGFTSTVAPENVAVNTEILNTDPGGATFVTTQGTGPNSTTVDLKQDGLYLALATMRAGGLLSNTKTGRFLHLQADNGQGDAIDHAYCHQASKDETGAVLATVLERSGSDVRVNLGLWQAPNTADNGGPDVSSSFKLNQASDSNQRTRLCLIRLPPSAQAVAYRNASQIEVSDGTFRELDLSVEEHRSANFSAASASRIPTAAAMDALCFGHFKIARSANLGAVNQNPNPAGFITVDGVSPGALGRVSAYVRGGDAGDGVMGSAGSVMGIVSVTSGQALGMAADTLSHSYAAGDDRTQPDETRLVVLDVESLADNSVTLSPGTAGETDTGVAADLVADQPPVNLTPGTAGEIDTGAPAELTGPRVLSPGTAGETDAAVPAMLTSEVGGRQPPTYSEIAELRYGRDLVLPAPGQATPVSSTGDWKTVAGLANLKAAQIRRATSPRGSIVWLDDYGASAIDDLEAAVIPEVLVQRQLDIEENALLDNRVEDAIAEVRVLDDGAVLTELRVTPAGEDEPVQFQIRET